MIWLANSPKTAEFLKFRYIVRMFLHRTNETPSAYLFHVLKMSEKRHIM